MAIWGWNKSSGKDDSRPASEPSAKQILDSAWQGASQAMIFYLQFREKYNVPFTPERWRDDFALGFRDGICHAHFFLLNNASGSSDAQFNWKMTVIRDDAGLEETWMKVVADNGGYTERAEAGIQAALILETWRLKQECLRGGLEYIDQHERDYRERHPEATQFNMDHWLILNHFVMPLIDADRAIHPYLAGL